MWFLLTVLCTSVLHLLLHAGGYAFLLRPVFRAYPPGPPEFVRQLQRSPDELVVWAMVVTSLGMGAFITTVISWSGAKTLGEGLRRGVVLGLLFWVGMNSGLYASSRFFSLPGALADTPLSALWMALSSAFAAWMLHARTANA